MAWQSQQSQLLHDLNLPIPAAACLGELVGYSEVNDNGMILELLGLP